MTESAATILYRIRKVRRQLTKIETRMPDISNFTKEELKELDWIITEGFSLFLKLDTKRPKQQPQSQRGK